MHNHTHTHSHLAWARVVVFVPFHFNGGCWTQVLATWREMCGTPTKMPDRLGSHRAAAAAGAAVAMGAAAAQTTSIQLNVGIFFGFVCAPWKSLDFCGFARFIFILFLSDWSKGGRHKELLAAPLDAYLFGTLLNLSHKLFAYFRVIGNTMFYTFVRVCVRLGMPCAFKGVKVQIYFHETFFANVRRNEHFCVRYISRPWHMARFNPDWRPETGQPVSGPGPDCLDRAG